MLKLFKSVLLLVTSLLVTNLQAEIRVQDDTGHTLVLEQPAQRIISLAPHVTELLFVAGGGDRVVGAVSFSDYPEVAKNIPRVGSYNKFDLEIISALQPDLVVAWKSGNPEGQLDEIRKLGFKIFITEPRVLDDVAAVIVSLGQLLATEQIANVEAKKFRAKLNELKVSHQNKTKLDVFYQVWNEPLFTVNGEHIISHVIELCGGNNVFKEMKVLAPRVSLEAVIEKNPEVIIAGMNESRKDWLNDWKKWKQLKAVKHNHLYPVNADLIVRHTPRILQGVEKVCGFLDEVRDERVVGE